ncbi:hypothetical protein TNCV_3591981 [Trichonephila clavipes]|nr:hypothetical protein TNCV_3591981 [Trichonephila clavipes]
MAYSRRKCCELGPRKSPEWINCNKKQCLFALKWSKINAFSCYPTKKVHKTFVIAEKTIVVIIVVDTPMMCRLIKKALDRSNAVEDSSTTSTAFSEKIEFSLSLLACLEKPGLNCWEAEYMFWRQSNIEAVWAMT